MKGIYKDKKTAKQGCKTEESKPGYRIIMPASFVATKICLLKADTLKSERFLNLLETDGIWFYGSKL